MHLLSEELQQQLPAHALGNSWFA